jgi:small basic protein
LAVLGVALAAVVALLGVALGVALAAVVVVLGVALGGALAEETKAHKKRRRRT